MAVFLSDIRLDTTGKSFTDEEPTYPTLGKNFLVAEYKNYAIQYEGKFVYDGDLLIGESLDRFIRTSEAGDIEYQWETNNPSNFNPAEVLTRTGEKYYKYILKEGDTIGGSPFKDLLNGYNGNDYIFGQESRDKLWGGKGKDGLIGGPGTDKMWGNGGKDTFYFRTDSDKDIVQDFNRKKDRIAVDTDLAGSEAQVKDSAKQKGDDVHFKIKGNTLVIKDYDIDKINKIKFVFTNELIVEA